MPIIPDSRLARVKTPWDITEEKIIQSHSVNQNKVELKLDDILSQESFKSLTQLQQYEVISQKIIKEKEGHLPESTEEWQYLTSPKSFYEGIIDKLNSYGLLLDNNRICDCGVGLGESIFNIYQQTKSINKSFQFFGIEKNKVLYDCFNIYLSKYWESIHLINDDIINQDLSGYNIVYTYTPFKNSEKLNDFYLKVIDELPTYGLLLESYGNGLGVKDCLYNLLQSDSRVDIIDLDGIAVYQKI